MSAGSGPSELRGAGDRLAPCPDSPNAVSSQAEDRLHSVEPIAYEGSGESALGRLLEILLDEPRHRLVSRGRSHAHVECRSLVFRFVDDLELLVDEAASVVHVRSASRLGYSDLGVNRRRVERLRSRFRASA